MNLGNDKALWLLFLVPAVLMPVYAWCFAQGPGAAYPRQPRDARKNQ